jgi:excisionase family DNA binding protein
MVQAGVRSDSLLLTIREACALLRVSRSSFYRLLDSGKLATVTVGGTQTVRVVRADLEAYVDSLRGESV